MYQLIYLRSRPSSVNIIAVSKRLGHESIKMTLDTYSHLMDGNEDKLIDTLEKIKKEEF